MKVLTNSSFQAFDLLSKNLRVCDFCNEFIDIYDINLSRDQVIDDWFINKTNDLDRDLADQIAIVEKRGKAVGYLSALDLFPSAMNEFLSAPEIDLDKDLALNDCIRPIEQSMIVTSDTSILEFAEIAAKSEHAVFFVYKGNKFIGWLSYNELNNSPFHICLFALILQLEETFLWALSLAPKTSFDLLSEGRQAKAFKLYQEKNYPWKSKNEPLYSILVGCTMIVDKITMLRRSPLTTKSVPAIHNRKFCKILEKTRNKVAHPNPYNDFINEIPRALLPAFLSWTRELTDQLILYGTDRIIMQ